MLELKCKKCNEEWADFDLEIDESQDFQTDKKGNVLTICEDCRHKKIDRDHIGVSALEYRIERGLFDQKTMELVNSIIHNLTWDERKHFYDIEMRYIHKNDMNDYIERVMKGHGFNWVTIYNMVAHLKVKNSYFLCDDDIESKFLDFYNLKTFHIEEIALDTIDLYNRLEKDNKK